MRCPVAIAHLVVPVTAPCEVAICIAIVSKIAGKTSRSGHVAKNLVASWCWHHHGGVLLILGVNPVDWATISVPSLRWHEALFSLRQSGPNLPEAGVVPGPSWPEVCQMLKAKVQVQSPNVE